MTTSGTSAFNPSLNEIIEEAYERAGTQVRSGNDFRSARRSLNILVSEWANRGLNLWTLQEASVTLTQGSSTFVLPVDCIDIVDHSIRVGSGPSQTDYAIQRIGVGTWANLSSKNQTGRPLQIFVERKAQPNIRVWPTPDTNYTLIYWYLRRIQDAGSTGTLTMDIPHRFVPALVAGLAYHIALKKSATEPQIMSRVEFLKNYYEEQFELAAGEDRDRSSLFLAPYQES